MHTRTRLITTVATLVLTAGACGGSPSPITSGGSAPTTTGPPIQGPAAVPEVLDFEAPLLGGGTLRGADLAGKDVAFWFWAPW